MARQAALGRYGFSLNGALATAPVPSVRVAGVYVDLHPELWDMVFCRLRHPALIMVAAGVCKDWHRIAWQCILDLIRRTMPFKIGYPYCDKFIFRERLFYYHQVILLAGASNMAIHFLIGQYRFAAFGVEESIIEKQTSCQLELGGYMPCAQCGTLAKKLGIVQSTYAFCNEACLNGALDNWARQHGKFIATVTMTSA
jgi:hypothetical protein